MILSLMLLIINVASIFLVEVFTGAIIMPLAIFGLIVIGFTCVQVLLKFIRRDPLFVISLEFWFYLLIFLYFSIGSSAHFVLSFDSEFRALMSSVVLLEDIDFIKLNAVVSLFLLIQLIFTFCLNKLYKNNARYGGYNSRKFSTALVIFIIYMTAVFLGSSLGGLFEEFKRAIAYALIFHLYRNFLKEKKRHLILPMMTIFLIEVYVGFEMASKLRIIMPILVVFIAHVSIKGVDKKFHAGGVILLMVFSALVPITESIRQQSSIELKDSFDNYITNFSSYLIFRLNHASVATYIINDGSGRYDTTDDWIDILVPRLIHEDKPNISFRGNELSRDIYGFDTTSSARTVIIDAYASNGLAGLLLINVFYLLIFMVGRSIVYRFNVNGSLTFLPLHFYMLNAIFNFEGMVSTSVIVPVFVSISIFVLLKAVLLAKK